MISDYLRCDFALFGVFYVLQLLMKSKIVYYIILQPSVSFY